MKNLIALLFVLSPLLLFAQEEMETNFQNDVAGILSFNEARITELANAFPDDKMDWRPADGIRSVKESVLHVAASNYYLIMMLGFTPPEGINVMDMEKMEGGKDKVMEALADSFAFTKEKVSKLEVKSLDEIVDSPLGKMSKRMVAMVILEHTGEHKGQLVAYARMNGIVPPWSE